MVAQIVPFLENRECSIMTHEKNIIYFRIISGVKRGLVLSPFLFILAIDCTLLDCTRFVGIQTGEAKQLVDLDFAEDIALTESKKTKPRDIHNTIRENTDRFCFKINTEKIKSMAATSFPLDIKDGNSIVKQAIQFRDLVRRA